VDIPRRCSGVIRQEGASERLAREDRTEQNRPGEKKRHGVFFRMTIAGLESAPERRGGKKPYRRSHGEG